ncbi:MAG TPA: cupin domain-containing protein, partial [Aquihabitans sp.]|nr:cupin domain-containing protein [Aquihabitans sp.]
RGAPLPAAPGGAANVEPLRPDHQLRFPRTSTSREAPLAAAVVEGREQASRALDAEVAGLDLPDLLQRPTDAVPRVATLRQDLLSAFGPRAIDDFVSTRDLRAGRLAVAHDGVPLNRPPPGDLYRAVRDPASPGRLDPARLLELLRRGATAIAFGVDDSVPELSRLAGLVERTAGVRSGANLYLSHGSHPSGFGPHWDDHDVLVIQVVGSKRWQLHRPNEPAPVLRHSSSAVSGERWATVVLEPGDVLYVPRGWGHDVTGCGGLSAHHTLPIRRPTGATVLAELAAAVPPGSRGSSTLGGPGARDVAESALARWHAALPPRPSLQMASPLHPTPAADAGLRLATAGGIAVVAGPPGADAIAVALGGVVAVVPTEDLPLLARLVAGHTVDPGVLTSRGTVWRDLVDAGALELQATGGTADEGASGC